MTSFLLMVMLCCVLLGMTVAVDAAVDATGPFQLRQRIGILRAVGELKRDGLLTKGMDLEEIKAAIAAKLMEDDPKTYANASFDWQKLFDLIMQMMPLIIMLFGL